MPHRRNVRNCGAVAVLATACIAALCAFAAPLAVLAYGGVVHSPSLRFPCASREGASAAPVQDVPRIGNELGQVVGGGGASPRHARTTGVSQTNKCYCRLEGTRTPTPYVTRATCVIAAVPLGVASATRPWGRPPDRPPGRPLRGRPCVVRGSPSGWCTVALV